MCQNGSVRNTGRRLAGTEAGWACGQESKPARQLVSGHWRAASGRQGGSGTGEGGHSVWGRSRARGSAWNGTREKTVTPLAMPRPQQSLDVRKARVTGPLCVTTCSGDLLQLAPSTKRGDRLSSPGEKASPERGGPTHSPTVSREDEGTRGS